MPLEPKDRQSAEQQRAALGGKVLDDKDRGILENATASRVVEAVPHFFSAVDDYKASIKAEDKALAEVAAAFTDIVFGFSAPIFANWALLNKEGRLAMAAGKLEKVLTLEAGGAIEKAAPLIAKPDILKESFKAVGKIVATEIKQKGPHLFGESDADDFANQLKVQFGYGIQGITDKLAAHRLTDEELIGTFLAYDVEYTNALAYKQALSKTFEGFKTYVRPIGTETAPTEVSGSDTATHTVWIVYAKPRLALIDDTTRLVPFLSPMTSRTFRSWIPTDMWAFAIAKNEREFGPVETIDPSSVDSGVPDPPDLTPEDTRAKQTSGPILIDAGPKRRPPIDAGPSPPIDAGPKRRLPIDAGPNRVTSQ